jgi:ABC-type multidrug transport system ATPase subunit
VALTITGLSKTYPNGVKALKNLSLSIGNNMFGLLGPNGAGKSSLMRTIATLQDPDSGSILLDEIDVLKDKPAVRKVLGYLPQEFGVYPKMSALDMLQHLAVMKGIANKTERNQMVDALLNQTNLWDARKKALSTYSGGMKQRFGIAQALLANPRLIIVDEPTAGLDPAERNRFLNLLSSIGSNVTVILSTHIVEDVRELCPRMAIIASGELLLEGSPNETLAALRGKIY